MLPQFKTFLYATDLGPGAPQAFRYALSLAQKYGAKIQILHAIEPLSRFGQSLVELHISHEQSEEIHRQAQRTLRADIVERLEKFRRDHAEDFCNGTDHVSGIEILDGQPAQVIASRAKSLGADLIIMGCHHHSALGRALLGSTAHKVMHQCQIPVMLVPIQGDEAEQET